MALESTSSDFNSAVDAVVRYGGGPRVGVAGPIPGGCVELLEKYWGDV